MDRRWNKLGEILVNKSAKVKSGEKVMIAMVEPEAFELTKAVYEEVIKVGGYPQVQILSEEFKHSLLKFGNDAQIQRDPDLEMYGMDWADVYFGLRGAHNFGELGEISTEKIAKHQEIMGRVSTQRWKNTRWVLCRIPTEAFAVQANCDLPSLMDMFFNACFFDFSTQKDFYNKILDKLNKGKQIRIVGEKTDLSFSIEGRKWCLLAADSASNMPEGEIFTGPVCETIDGEIYFEHPGVLGGKLMNDISFKWDKGKLISATCSTQQEYFHSIIYDNPGAQTIGEFAFGLNPEMTRFCNDILFDEKIFGTIHIAMGRAYPITGATNKSSIHWDIIKEMRSQGSVVFLDGEPIFKEGKFLI